MQAERQFSYEGWVRRASLVLSSLVFLIVLVVGLIIRLDTAPLYAHPETDNLRALTDAVHEFGLFNAYRVSDATGHAPIEIASLGLATQIFHESQTGTDAVASQRSEIKAASIFFDTATVIAAYLLIFKLAGPLWALLPAVAISLNPAIIMESSIWGQTDSIFTFFLVLSVAALYFRWNKSTWVAWALSVMSKVQALSLLPLLVTGTLVPRTAGSVESASRYETSSTWRRLMVGIGISALVVVVIMVPFFMGSGENAWQGLKQNEIAFPGLTHDAYNFWWWQSTRIGIIPSNAGDAMADQNVPGLPVSYRAAGWILFGGFVLLGMVKGATSRQGRNEFLMAGLLQVGFFMFLPQVQERNLYPAIALFALASVGWDRSGRPRIDWRGVFFFSGFSLSLTYNLVATSALTPPQLLSVLTFLFPGGRDDVAGFNVLLLIVSVIVLIWPRRFKMPTHEQLSSLYMPARPHGQ